MENRGEFKCPKDIPESQIVHIDINPEDKIMSQEEIDNLLTRIVTDD